MKTIALKCDGVGRDGGNEKALVFYFNRTVTDDEMRFIHATMRRVITCLPSIDAKEKFIPGNWPIR